MGLHYRSDSEAGKLLASEVTKLVGGVSRVTLEDGKRPILYETLMRAWIEWRPNQNKTEQDFENAWAAGS